MISRICEEFGCTPSVAIREPLALMLEIMELRQYARTKQAVDQAKDDASMPKGPMVDLVFEVEHELIQERNARIRARQGLDK